MFLKRLQITGFKSFVDKAVFELPAGIIAIVGPNGCGKSNIAEAIRWVLGEQIPSNLRSKAMGEVIFDGCEARKPVGLAEVSLTLDNSRKILPIEFEEVNIARRLFRSGESEYLINKAPCRLKDITDLFLDTGIGRHAYSLMEQGKVDLILNSKPKERRAFFEEAAGVMKYRNRREATLHKLEGTCANLTRLEDVLSEIKRQMNSLYRQKKRAERYKMFKEEIKELEVGIQRYEYLQLKDSFNETSRELERMRAELARKKEREAGLSASLDEARSKMKEVREELNLLQDSAHKFTTKIQEINTETIRLRERESHLNSETMRLTRQIKDLNTRIDEITSNIEKENSSRQQWVEELKSKRENLAAKEQKLASLEEEKENWLSSLELSKEEQIELLAQVARIRNRMATLRVEEKNTKIQLARITGEQKDFEENERQASFRLVKEEETLSLEKGELDYLLEEILEDEARILEEEKALSDLDDQINSLRAELKAAEVQFDALERLEKDFTGYFSGVKSILTSDQLSGIRGVVADLLDVPPQYEAAIEAALGESLQAIVAEKIQDAKTAIDYLKKEGRERVTLLPLDGLKIDSPPEIPAGHKIIGRASDLVRFKPELAPAFNYLLGHVYIIDELEIESGALKEIRGYLKLVSLKGDVLDTSGVMSGGSQRTRGLGLLGRKRAINDLQEKIGYFKSHLPGLETQREIKKGEMKDLREKFTRKKEKSQELELSISSGQRECERSKEELSQNRLKLADLKGEHQLLTEELNKADQEIKKLTLDQRELVQKTRQKQNFISKLQEEINEREILVKEYGLEITQLKVDVAGLNERLEGLCASISKLDELLASLQGERGHLEESLSQAHQEREEGRLSISSLEKQVEGLRRDKKLGDERLSKIRLTYEDMEQELIPREEEPLRARKEVEEVAERVYQFDLKASQIKVKMDGIGEHLMREYGLSPEEITSPISEEIQLDESRARLEELRPKMEQLGEVNLMAPKEYEELKERYEMMNEQRDDLLAAEADLRNIIAQIDKTSRELFLASFKEIRSNFQQVYQELFEGGRSDLIMTEDDPLETGIDIVAQPPGKRLQNISLLSGGERALTAIALLFAVFMIKPSPFCVLDEIDAALDEANINRFTKMLKKFSQSSQFLIITHSKRTMEISDTLYGITMEELGVSKLISVRWKEKAG